MATTGQERQPFWQQRWFVESNWISTGTKWLLTFGGKAARITLIICTLYMSAELYPGVTLPAGLNLAVLIILSFALDMGGIGLAQIAKTAREHGNVEGAEQGEKLAGWLIGIMIAGLVSVSLEHAVTLIPLTPEWKNGVAVFWMIVEIVLSIARVICAVNYGHVVHALEQSVEQGQTQEQEEREAQQAEIERLQHEVSTLRVQLDTSKMQMDTLDGQVQEKEKEVSTLRVQVESGQQEVSSLRNHLDSQHAQLTGEQSIVDALKQRLMEAEQEVSTLRGQMNGKQAEVSNFQDQVSTLQQQVSTLTVHLDAANKKVDTPRGQLDRRKVSTVDSRVDSGQPKTDTQVDSRVIQLDSKKREQQQENERSLDDQMKAMLANAPGLSDRAIASKLGCSPTTVGKRRKALLEQTG